MGPIRGRASEVEVLRSLVSAAGGGAGGVAIVEGPVGIGKSRLLEEAAEIGAEEGMTVAAARCDELDPISPWGVLVRALASTKPPLLEPSVLGSLPERLDRRPAALDELRTALERAAARGPVMVVLDDLQWADPATIAALGRLPEQLFSYPIVWLLARRTLPAEPALEVLVGRLEGAGAEHLRLGPLAETEASLLAADVSGGRTEQEASALITETGGNPLFVIEVVRTHLGAPGDGAAPLKGRHATPSSLQAAVDAHLRSLLPETRELLKLTSVIGRDFSVAEAAGLTGRTTGQLLGAVEEALAAEVLAEEGEQLAFRHDMFRQVLYESLPASMRRSLHRDAATVLQRSGASPTRLAHQLLIGTDPGDAEAIAALYGAIGELAGTSPWAAADVALQIVELTDSSSSDGAFAVSVAVQLLGWAGRLDEARQLGEGFLERVGVGPETEAEILLGVRRAWVTRHARPYPSPVDHRFLEDAAIRAPLRACLLAFGQMEDLFSGDCEVADRELGRAAALLAGAGGDLDEVSVKPLWVLAAQFRGEFGLALERARQDLDLLVSTSAEASSAVSESTVAQCLGGLGRPLEGLAAVDAAMKGADTSGYPFVTVHCHCLRAAFFLDLGRIEDARAESAAAARLAADYRFLDYLTLAVGTFVEASVRAGDLASANAALERLAQHDEEGSIIADRWWANAICADAHGRPVVALHSLDVAVGQLAGKRYALPSRHPVRLAQLVGLAMRCNEESIAEVAVSAAEDLARRNDSVPFLEQVALHARGVCERDPSRLESAVKLAEASDGDLARATLYEDLGSVEAELGRRDGAVEPFEAAYSAYTRMGAARDSARMRGELRKLGVRKRAPAAGRPDRGWDSLTPAELSVVRVVGRGATNRETAAELFVSPDTVNTHLRHAFMKLGIRSRTELARMLAVHEPA